MAESNKVEIVIQGTDKTGAASKSAGSNLTKLGQMAIQAAKGFAAIWAAREIIGFTQSIINLADETGKMAEKVGASVEFMSAMNHAAELNDLSAQQLQTSFKELNSEIATNSNVLRNLGVSTRDAAGNFLAIDDVLPQIADKFADMADGAQKSKLATDLFGRAGLELIPMLNQGSAGLKDMSDEARRLGLIIDKETAKQADEFNDNLTKLKGALTGFGLAIARDILPFLVEFSKQLVEVSAQSGPLNGLFITINESIGKKVPLWKSATESMVNYFTLLRLGLEGVELSPELITAALSGSGMFAEPEPGPEAPSGPIDIKSGNTTQDLTEFWKLYDQLRTDALVGDENATARAEEMENQHHQANLARIDEVAQTELDAHMLTEAEFARHLAVIEENERAAGERRRQMQVRVANGIANTFGDMAAAAQAFGKKGFKAWKAFATAQALVNTYSSAVGAYNAMVGIPYIGPALAVAAAIAATAAGLANVAAIQGTEPQGAAHGGMTYIPSESTYQVAAGERILSPRQNTDLTAALEGGGLAGSKMLNITLNLDGVPVARWLGDMSRDGRLEIDGRAVV